MKILHYLTDVDLRSGGVVRAVLDLCYGLSALPLDVTLAFCATSDGFALNGTTRLCRIGDRPNILGRFSRRAVSRLSALIRNSDVVHLHAPWDPANLQVAQLCRQYRVPYVISVHGMLDDWAMGIRTLKKALYLQTVGRRFISSAGFVHCTAEEERKQATRRVFGIPTVVIPLVLDLRAYEILPGEASARALFAKEQSVDFRILFLGRVFPGKGLEYAIEALATLRATGMAASLVVAGPGDASYLAKLKLLAQERSVDTFCHFLGHVEGPLKISLFQICQVLVLPSEHENFGLVLPEALAAGLPVITTKNVAIWRELNDSKGAAIVERSAQDFAQAIRALYDDPDLLAAMGQRGREWAMKTFSGPEIARQYEAMYQETLQRMNADGSVRPDVLIDRP